MYKKIIFVAIVAMLVFVGCGEINLDNNSTEQTENKDEVNTQIQESDSEEETTTEEEAVTEEDSEEISEIVEKEKVLYAQGSVNVRSLPSTDGDKLGILTVNEEVIGLGDAIDGWQKIRYKVHIAYVSAKYLSESKFNNNNSSTESPKQMPEITANDIPLPADFDPNGIVVVIDAGHQGKGNSSKEPDGPGSSTLKAKVTSGATGCVTKQKEYVLNLVVSLKLRDELKSRGYQVVMIREDHAINISNSERAKFANNLNADAFIRIHANSSDNASVHGVETICQTSSNPYNANLYKESRRLSDLILDRFVENTGATKRKVWETDTMSGINWCEVPVTIVEMGFLSNPDEDRLLSTEEYQNKIVEGIANGLDDYFFN